MTPPGPPDPRDSPDARLPLRLRGSTTAVLALLCVLVALVGGYLLLRQDRAGSEASDGTLGPVTSVAARDDGASAARRLTTRVLSYGWDSLERDAAAVDRVAAPGFRREYARTMASVRTQTLRDHVTTTAKVVGTGVVTATPARVVALVYVDQRTTARGSARARQDQNRVLVTLTSDGGEWRVSRMDAF